MCYWKSKVWRYILYSWHIVWHFIARNMRAINLGIKRLVQTGQVPIQSWHAFCTSFLWLFFNTLKKNSTLSQCSPIRFLWVAELRKCATSWAHFVSGVVINDQRGNICNLWSFGLCKTKDHTFATLPSSLSIFIACLFLCVLNYSNTVLISSVATLLYVVILSMISQTWW